MWQNTTLNGFIRYGFRFGALRQHHKNGNPVVISPFLLPFFFSIKNRNAQENRTNDHISHILQGPISLIKKYCFLYSFEIDFILVRWTAHFMTPLKYLFPSFFLVSVFHSHRYGREDEEVMGLKFCNEAIIALKQIWPTSNEKEPLTPLQVSFEKKNSSQCFRCVCVWIWTH